MLAVKHYSFYSSVTPTQVEAEDLTVGMSAALPARPQVSASNCIGIPWLIWSRLIAAEGQLAN